MFLVIFLFSPVSPILGLCCGHLAAFIWGLVHAFSFCLLLCQSVKPLRMDPGEWPELWFQASPFLPILGLAAFRIVPTGTFIIQVIVYWTPNTPKAPQSQHVHDGMHHVIFQGGARDHSAFSTSPNPTTPWRLACWTPLVIPVPPAPTAGCWADHRYSSPASWTWPLCCSVHILFHLISSHSIPLSCPCFLSAESGCSPHIRDDQNIQWFW